MARPLRYGDKLMAIYLSCRKSKYNIDDTHQKNAIKLMSYESSPQVTKKLLTVKGCVNMNKIFKKQVLFGFPYNKSHTVNSRPANTSL